MTKNTKINIGIAFLSALNLFTMLWNTWWCLFIAEYSTERLWCWWFVSMTIIGIAYIFSVVDLNNQRG